MLLVTIASFTIINEVLAATPCDSHLRKMRPDLFKHCDNACPYGQWGSWSIISKFRTDQCNSSKAYNQTRTRHSFIKTCPSQSESKAICKCLKLVCTCTADTMICIYIIIAKHCMLQLALNTNITIPSIYIITFVLW